MQSVGSIKLGCLLLSLAVTVGCSAPAEADASADADQGALVEGESEAVRLATAVRSTAAKETLVDEWDLAIVTKGGASYLVASGYTVDANVKGARRVPALDIVVTTVENKPTLWMRSPTANEPVSVTEARAKALAADFAAMRSPSPTAGTGAIRPAALNRQCKEDLRGTLIGAAVAALSSAAAIPVCTAAMAITFGASTVACVPLALTASSAIWATGANIGATLFSCLE